MLCLNEHKNPPSDRLFVNHYSLRWSINDVPCRLEDKSKVFIHWFTNGKRATSYHSNATSCHQPETLVYPTFFLRFLIGLLIFISGAFSIRMSYDWQVFCEKYSDWKILFEIAYGLTFEAKCILSSRNGYRLNLVLKHISNLYTWISTQTTDAILSFIIQFATYSDGKEPQKTAWKSSWVILQYHL